MDESGHGSPSSISHGCSSYDRCLTGRFALITGGGSGIGFEITRQLLRAGCSGVMICGRRGSFLERACRVLKAETNSAAVICYEVCDVRIPEQCCNAIDSCRRNFGHRLDILVNGAAGNFLSPAASLTPKGFATVMSIDAMGTFNMSNAARPLLAMTKTQREYEEQSTTVGWHLPSNAKSTSEYSSTCLHDSEDDAVIVNISATLQYGATWWQAHASAAKAAVDSLTRSLALEWGGSGEAVDGTSFRRSIRVVGIAPGPIADTPGTTKLAPGLGGGGDNHVSDLVTKRIPLGRMGRADEIGKAVVFLCVSKFVTGHTLVVDGGEWLHSGPPLIPHDMVAQLSRNVEAASRGLQPRLLSKF